MKKKAAAPVDINTLRNLPDIEALWKDADAKGRCWGPKRKKGNPLSGSQITIFRDREMVAIVFDEKLGQPVIFEYDETCATKLGRDVLVALKRGGFDPALKATI